MIAFSISANYGRRSLLPSRLRSRPQWPNASKPSWMESTGPFWPKTETSKCLQVHWEENFSTFGYRLGFSILGPTTWNGLPLESIPHTSSFGFIDPSLWNHLLPHFRSFILSAPFSLCLSRLKSYLFLELKCTESAYVWLTQWEALL